MNDYDRLYMMLQEDLRIKKHEEYKAIQARKRAEAEVEALGNIGVKMEELKCQ